MDLAGSLASGAPLLCEPKVLVGRRAFAEALQTAAAVGLQLAERPRVGLSGAALLRRLYVCSRCVWACPG